MVTPSDDILRTHPDNHDLSALERYGATDAIWVGGWWGTDLTGDPSEAFTTIPVLQEEPFTTNANIFQQLHPAQLVRQSSPASWVMLEKQRSVSKISTFQTWDPPKNILRKYKLATEELQDISI